MPRFLAYTLHSVFGQSQFKLAEYGGTKQGLGLDDVRDVLVLLPGHDEQHEIVTELDVQTTRIMAAIDRAKEQIELIREYRTRLITDVITGKLDVRGVELPTLFDAGPVMDYDAYEDAGKDIEPEEMNDTEGADA